MKKTRTFLKQSHHPKFYIRCFFVMLMIFSTQITFAQEIYMPVELSGFNEDVIVEALPALDYSSTSVDNEFNSNYAFITEDVNTNGGLPSDGILVSDQNPQLEFHFQPYDEEEGNNSLRLENYEEDNLIFINPIKAKSIFVLLTSGNGNTNTEIDINFENGDSQTHTATVRDWDINEGFGDLPIAKSELARINRGNNTIESQRKFLLSQWEIPINLENQDKLITSVTIRKNSTSSSKLNVFAITAEPICTEPIIIEADKDYLCDENDEIILTAQGGDPGVIYFQGNDQNGFHTNLGGSTQTVTGPGTYYFRAYNEEEDCWGVPQSITIDISDIDFDAGEDQYLGCGGSAQIGFEPDLWEQNNSTTFSWSPLDGLDDPTIPNPIASPDVTTTYTLTVIHEDCEFTDAVTVTVDHCLPPLVICVGDEINLNEGLPEGVNPNDVIWYEDDNNSPGTEINSFDDLTAGTYWASFDGKDWKMEVSISFTEECLECYEVMHEKSGQSNQIDQNIIPADYGVLDLYEVPDVLRVLLNNTNIINSNWFNFNTDINIQFTDGAQWGSGGIDPITDLIGSEDKPLIRIVFGPSGIEGFYGSRASADDPNYQLEPLELINGVSFVDVVWYSLTPNNKLQIAKTTGDMSFYFRSLNIIPCPPTEVFINPQIKHRVQP